MASTPKSENSLCANHKLFIAEYIKNGRNGTQAYWHVYGKDKTEEVASVCASQLLSLPKVRAVLDKRFEDIATVAGIDAAWALKKRIEIVEFSMRGYDAPGANAALNAIEKVHLGMTEKQEVDSTLTVVIKSFKTDAPNGN